MRMRVWIETALIGATTFPAAQDLADLQNILQPLRHHLSDRLVMLKISCLHGES